MKEQDIIKMILEGKEVPVDEAIDGKRLLSDVKSIIGSSASDAHIRPDLKDYPENPIFVRILYNSRTGVYISPDALKKLAAKGIELFITDNHVRFTMKP